MRKREREREINGRGEARNEEKEMRAGTEGRGSGREEDGKGKRERGISNINGLQLAPATHLVHGPRKVIATPIVLHLTLALQRPDHHNYYSYTHTHIHIDAPYIDVGGQEDCRSPDQ